jgi:ribosomal protein L40E
MEEKTVWLKRCKACDGLNQPLALKCEHCGYEDFEWKEKDKPPNLDRSFLKNPYPPFGEEHLWERLYFSVLSMAQLSG